MSRFQSSDPVAAEPRLFVGQLPSDCTEEMLFNVFSPFGTVKNLHLLKGGDGKPRGCAMVLFTKYSHAEQASEALDGTQLSNSVQGLQSGSSRPLVVHFANPRRSPPGSLQSENGIAPRKLFVGQVPRDLTEEQLRPYFEPFGEVEHINILRTQKGQSAGCAFVQYSKWAACEQAIENHNGKTRLGNSEVPLVVKFADAKRKQPAMGYREGWMGDKQLMGRLAAEQAAYGYQGRQQWPGGLMQQSNGLLGGTMMGGMRPGMINPNLAAYNQGMGGYQMGDAALLNEMGNLPAVEDSGMDPRMAGMPPGADMGNPLLQANLAQSLGRNLPEMVTSEAALAQQLTNLDLSNLAQQSDLAQHPDLAHHPELMEGSGGGRGKYMGGPGGMPPGGGYPPQMGGGPQMGGQFGGGYMQGGPGMGPHMGDEAGRPWGQKIGSNDKYNEWKLFIGQVPLEATEEDIWQLFSPVGNIMELYILRNNNGKSRGCAFVTYANKYLAEQAITQLNGKQVPPGKTLVVKFADRAIAGKPIGASQQLPNFYMR